MLPKILRFFGYSLAFVLFLLLFVRMTFPTDELGAMLRVRIADATGAKDVQLEEVSLLGLIPSGVSLEGLEISFPDVTLKGAEIGKDKKVGRVIQADLIELSAALGALSSGEIDASFEGIVMGGEIKGGRAIVPKDGMAEIRIESMSGVALGPERLFAAAIGFDVLGTLSGSIDLKIPVSDVEGRRKFDIGGIDGVIDLAISDTVINDPVVERSQMRQALTDVKLGTLKLLVRASNGGAKAGDVGDGEGKRARVSTSTTIQLEEFSASGPDVQVGIAPRSAVVIPPGRTLAQGTIRAHFAIQVDPNFITREVDDPKAPGTKMQPNKIISLLLEDLTRKGHLKDNDIGLGITGPLSKPAVTTEPPRTRIGASGTAGRRMNVQGDDEPTDEEDASDDGAEATPPPAARPMRAGSAEITRPVIGGGRPVAAVPMGRRPGRFDPRNPSGGPNPNAPIAPPNPMVPPDPMMPPDPMGDGEDPETDFNEDPAE